MTQPTPRTPQATPVAQAEPATAPVSGDASGCPTPTARGLAQGWCALSALHGRIESHIERALQSGHQLSVREFSVLNVLSEQHDGPGGHLRMHQVADAVVLSQSATTRLVTRLEERSLLSRYLCADDRRGIYTDVTADGLALLAEARPTHDTALSEALTEAARRPELAPLVRAVETLAPTV
ncbi:MarR family transcriptional regulator [Streptomyces sp. NBC_01525]|uniref:MarR family transcriptional regulator n=1 Tax=Streptomyces benahoarensis TaxID=2595054 RepID=A0A553ZRN5_9ACTN|nr:MarR family transcriptional regulator [Streptomyces benahoarensis]TSB18817.1 MarR family transcriptional regulator [Streptomyces benahoarensis]TSB44015.1 MarR family transcriptional regulator [Streptomyces benahoarensis]